MKHICSHITMSVAHWCCQVKRMPHRFLVCGILLMFVLAGGILFFPGIRAEGESTGAKVDDVVSYESVLICKGDSLWSIAMANMDNPTHAEIQAYVEEIISLNNISSTCIHTGNYIVIPKYS